MADYYSLLSRAVANLPKPSPPAARKAVYDRARRALNNQLRALKPPMLESEIAREEAALEAAVMRLEAEVEASGDGAAAPAVSGEPKPASTSPRPASRHRGAIASLCAAAGPTCRRRGARRAAAGSSTRPAPPRSDGSPARAAPARAAPRYAASRRAAVR